MARNNRHSLTAAQYNFIKYKLEEIYGENGEYGKSGKPRFTRLDITRIVMDNRRDGIHIFRTMDSAKLKFHELRQSEIQEILAFIDSRLSKI